MEDPKSCRGGAGASARSHGVVAEPEKASRLSAPQCSVLPTRPVYAGLLGSGSKPRLLLRRKALILWTSHTGATRGTEGPGW